MKYSERSERLLWWIQEIMRILWNPLPWARILSMQTKFDACYFRIDRISALLTCLPFTSMEWLRSERLLEENWRLSGDSWRCATPLRIRTSTRVRQSDQTEDDEAAARLGFRGTLTSSNGRRPLASERMDVSSLFSRQFCAQLPLLDTLETRAFLITHGDWKRATSLLEW